MTTSRAPCAPTTPRRSHCWARGAPTNSSPAPSAIPRRHLLRQVQAAGVERAQPIDHRAHRQGRLLVHPSRPAPNAVGPRGRANPDVPRLVPLRGRAEPAIPPDRQRGPATARRAQSAEHGHVALTSPERRGRRAQRARGFRDDLLDWHRDNSRDFPWRRRGRPLARAHGRDLPAPTRRPTRCARCTRRSPSWRRHPPTWSRTRTRRVRRCGPSAFAGGRTTWSKIARALVDDHGGEVPGDSLALRQLPGVGDYVANAVLTFGFGRRAVIVDTNTARIAAESAATNGGRCGGSSGSTSMGSRDVTDRTPSSTTRCSISGQQICRAGTPLCEDCPVGRHCATHPSGPGSSCLTPCPSARPAEHEGCPRS